MAKTTSPAPASGPEGCSTEIRKIDNGYVMRHSTYGGKGGYESREVYSPGKPEMPKVVAKAKEAAAPRAPSPLARAIKRMGAVAGLLLALSGPVVAQQSVFTIPGGVSVGGNASSTVGSTDVFQALWSAGTRRGCLVQNTSTHTQYLYFGAIAAATKALSVQVAAGAIFYCQSGGAVIQDAVSITGTSADTFVALGF